MVLTPGPPEEVEVVRRLYRLFVLQQRSETEIAAQLNAEGLVTDRGQPWTRATVHQVLTNEKYIGNNVFNRSSFKLKTKRVTNTPDMWVRKNSAFPGIVDADFFEAAQRIIRARSARFTDDELLAKLAQVLQSKGALSGVIIDEFEDMPSSSVYRHRFGSLLQAYQLIGYSPDRDYRYIEANRAIRAMHPDIMAAVLAGFSDIDDVVASEEDGLVTINDEFTASIVIARCQETPAGGLRWKIRLDQGLRPDITIAVRMQPGNLELVRAIGALRERGYTITEVAAKVDFSHEYVSAICYLLENGEEKLISAVELGVIPHTIAMEIARAKDGDVQQALAQAYEEKSIPGNQVLAIRKIIEQRNSSGKGIHHARHWAGRVQRPATPDNLIRSLQRETERQRSFVRRASITQSRLRFVVNAFRHLLADDRFTLLMKAEGIHNLPTALAARIGPET